MKEKRYIKYRDNNPVRGAIYDRNKFPLAVSIVNYDLYALNGLNIDNYLRLKDILNLEIELQINEPFKKRLF